VLDEVEMAGQEYVDNFRRRVMQDALSEATAAYWIRRAEVFEGARHRPGDDYPGVASLDDLRERWVALTELAQACRHRAAVAQMQDGIEPEVFEALREAS